MIRQRRYDVDDDNCAARPRRRAARYRLIRSRIANTDAAPSAPNYSSGASSASVAIGRDALRGSVARPLC